MPPNPRHIRRQEDPCVGDPRTLFDQLLQERGLERVRGYGNLPYSVAAPILLRLLTYATRFDSLTLMFQKEVAERLTAVPGTKAYGRLSIVTQWLCEAKPLFEVPLPAALDLARAIVR